MRHMVYNVEMIYKVLKLHNIDNNSICKRVYEIQSNDHSLVVEGSSSYLTEYNYIKDKAFEPLLNEITNILNGYYIEDVWFNIYKKGGYVKPHHHNTDKSNKYLSAIYNVKKPLNSGDFYLSNTKIDMNEGDFYAFTSNDMHHTTPSQSDKDRIVMSFNLIKDL